LANLFSDEISSGAVDLIWAEAAGRVWPMMAAPRITKRDGLNIMVLIGERINLV
jgi:hypothetical protein